MLIRITWAPRAISSGMESPMGEPLATLPPRVPELRTGRPAKRLAKVLSCGRSATSAAKASVSVTAAPMAMWCGYVSTRRSSSTWVTSSTWPNCMCILVTHSPASVQPATSCASGCGGARGQQRRQRLGRKIGRIGLPARAGWTLSSFNFDSKAVSSTATGGQPRHLSARHPGWAGSRCSGTGCPTVPPAPVRG